MTWFEADAHRLAARLAVMLTTPGETVAASDSGTVNQARRGVRLWCRQILDDQGRPDHELRTARAPQLADLTVDPVGVLRSLLRRDPASLELRPGSVGADAPTVNQRWAQLGRDAELATHSWTTSDPASRPTGEHAWALVADVAAVAEAAALLDRHLAEQHPDGRASHVGREADDLRLAAQHVLRTATAGPLPPPTALTTAASRLAPTPVPTLDQLPAALTNLARLLTGRRRIRPSTLSRLIGHHIPVVETLARTLPHDLPVGPRDERSLADTLHTHGRWLADVRAALRPLRSIDADDQHAILQATAINTFMKHAPDPARLSDGDTHRAVLASLWPALAVTTALRQAVMTNVQTGRWLEPTHAEPTRWRKISNKNPVTGSIGRAAAHAAELLNQLPPPVRPQPPYRTPHDVLTPHLLTTNRTRSVRPITAALNR